MISYDIKVNNVPVKRVVVRRIETGMEENTYKVMIHDFTKESFTERKIKHWFGDNEGTLLEKALKGVDFD